MFAHGGPSVGGRQGVRLRWTRTLEATKAAVRLNYEIGRAARAAESRGHVAVFRIVLATCPAPCLLRNRTGSTSTESSRDRGRCRARPGSLRAGARTADVDRHREADDLGRGFEVSEGIAHLRYLLHSPTDSIQVPLTLPFTACTHAESLAVPLHPKLRLVRYLHDRSDCYRLERLLPAGIRNY